MSLHVRGLILNNKIYDCFYFQIFINDTDAFALGDFKIVKWLSPVIDIKRDGEHVYAMTKHAVIIKCNTY